jgi:formate dehydrogenase subunit delta
MSHDDKLVYMANQIGKFFASQGEAKAADGIATHFRRFWDPSMRRGIIARLAAGEAHGLDPLPLRAVQLLATDASRLHTGSDPAKIAAGFTPSETGTNAA